LARSVTAAESFRTFAASLDADAAVFSCVASVVSAVLRCAPDRRSALVSAVRVDVMTSADSPYERSS